MAEQKRMKFEEAREMNKKTAQDKADQKAKEIADVQVINNNNNK